jgi:hypothetical protein
MYKTFLEVIEAVEEKFSNVSGLGISVDSGAPTYVHKISESGIGCAIGCLLESDDSIKLQNTCIEIGTYSIDSVIDSLETTDFFTMFDFSGDLKMEHLIILQTAHDESNSHNEFMDKLANLHKLLVSPVYVEYKSIIDDVVTSHHFAYNINNTDWTEYTEIWNDIGSHINKEHLHIIKKGVENV